MDCKHCDASTTTHEQDERWLHNIRLAHALWLRDEVAAYSARNTETSQTINHIPLMKEINTEHRYYYEDGSIVDCFGEKMDSVDEYADEMGMLLGEIRKYKIALHDAIDRPKGLVPESAENLYDQTKTKTMK